MEELLDLSLITKIMMQNSNKQKIRIICIRIWLCIIDVMMVRERLFKIYLIMGIMEQLLSRVIGISYKISLWK